MTTRLRDEWTEMNRGEKTDVVLFVLKISPLLLFLLFARFWLWAIGEVDEIWPAPAYTDNSEVPDDVGE